MYFVDHKSRFVHELIGMHFTERGDICMNCNFFDYPGMFGSAEEITGNINLKDCKMYSSC